MARSLTYDALEHKHMDLIENNKQTTKVPEHGEHCNGNAGEASSQAVFKRSSMLMRTPPDQSISASPGVSCSLAHAITTSTSSLQQAENETVRTRQNESVYNENAVETPIQTPRQYKSGRSPRQEFILKMRSEEDAAISKCRRALREIKTAIKKQKNISKVVQDSADEMTELFEVIATCRKSWQEAEQETRKAAIRNKLGDVETPNTSKRAATSPVKQDAEKKAREREPEPAKEDWKVVRKRSRHIKEKPKVPSGTTSAPDDGAAGVERTMDVIKHKSDAAQRTATERRKKTKRRKLPREALLIKPAEGKTYAEVLREIRTKVNPADTETVVRAIRRTRSGEVLVELGRQTGDKAAFGNNLRSSLGGAASVRTLEPKETVEIRDLDDLTTAEEVTAAVISATGGKAENLVVSLTNSNNRAQRMAIVTLSTREARILLTAQHIKVGWVSCRVRERVQVPRCFRCLNYGHHANTCKGPDRSRLCFKCMKGDHKAKQCSSPEHCALCAEMNTGLDGSDHAAGSRKCGVYRGVLERSKLLAR